MELKEWTASEIEEYDNARLELAEDGKIDCTRVYIKSEADKVIAEKDTKITQLEALIENYNRISGEIIDNANYQKYKRCLTMAKWCFTKSNYHFVLARHGEDAKENNRRSILYSKWRLHWLELAEKFKEVK